MLKSVSKTCHNWSILFAVGAFATVTQLLLNKKTRSKIARAPIATTLWMSASASISGFCTAVVGGLFPPVSGPLIIVGSSLYAFTHNPSKNLVASPSIKVKTTKHELRSQTITKNPSKKIEEKIEEFEEEIDDFTDKIDETFNNLGDHLTDIQSVHQAQKADEDEADPED